MLLLLLAACKPTEQNYKSAYDKAYEAAQQKKEQEAASATGAKLESLDGPRRDSFDGQEFLVGHEKLKPYETSIPADGLTYGVAISKFRMPTNARRQLDDIIKDYPEAFVATDGNEGFYLVIARVAAIHDAAAPIREFLRSNPSAGFMGLPGAPVVFPLSL